MVKQAVSNLLSILLCAAGLLEAQTRTSPDYEIETEVADSAGGRSGSASYTNDGSIGGLVGISTVAGSSEINKAGYIGQLYEVIALKLAATTTAVDEEGSRQLGAELLLDDNTIIEVAAGAVLWSVLSGPLGIDPNGLVTADAVFQDSIAQVQGDYSGFSDILDLTVIDADPDNFGSYAGDGIDDDWQWEYFGNENPLAAPGIDADGDGQDNYFEFTAGVIPTDPGSYFQWRVGPVPGQPDHTRIVFSPRLADRVYNLQTSTTLETSSWITLTGATETDDGDERTVTDPSTTPVSKFYRLGISKP